MSTDENDFEKLYYVMRREAFVSQVAHSKGIELANLILNTGSIGDIKECARQFRAAIKSAQRSMDRVDAGDIELAEYFGMRSGNDSHS